MIRSKIAMGFLWALLALVLHVVPGAVGPACAQGSRKDDIVFNSRGIPLAGATVRVCAMPASGQPCTPLALIYSDAALTQALANPTTSDGLGNYFFYAAPGKYEIEISGPSITTKQIPNVILPNDPASPAFSGAVSAFSLNLSGNLTVNGSTTVIGNLASGSLNLSNQSTPPGAAGTGTVNVYTKTTDKRLYYKDESGTEVGPLGPGTGAQTNSVNTFTANQNFDNGMHIKGPDPYSDITRYGKFATYSSTTANTTSGQPTVAVASAQSFQNGEYVTVFNAGPSCSLATPAAPTVTPSSNAGGLNAVAAGTGASSFNYQVVAADKFGCYTPASPSTSISTGTTLGMQTIAISTMVRSGTTVTVTTAAAHPFVAGSEVFIQYFNGNTDLTFNGWFIVATAQDNTHFTFLGGFDTALGATTSDTGGTVIGFNVNRLTGYTVANAWKYYIYGRTGGTFTLLGQTTENFWDDFGSPMNDNKTFPPFIPTTPPVSGANDHLTAKISSGGGTTTLTLAANAGASVTGKSIVSDDGPVLAAACASFANPCYIPLSAGARVSSYTQIPHNARMIVAGGVTLDDTIELAGSVKIEGWTGPSQASFAWEGNGAGFGSTKAYPLFVLAGVQPIFSHVDINCQAANGCLGIYDTGVTNFTMDNSVIASGGGNTTDYLGMHAIFQGHGFSFRFDKDTFSTGSPGANTGASVGFSPIPTVVFKNQGGAAGFPTANWAITRSWLVGRSSFDQDWVTNSSGINWMIAKDIQTQNSFLPPFMITGVNVTAGVTGHVDFEDITPADFPTAVLANLVGGAGTAGLWLKQVTCSQGGNLITTGAQFMGAQVYDVCHFGQNSNFIAGSYFANNAVGVSGAGSIGYLTLAPTAPTLAALTGTNLSTGAHTVKLAWFDANGNVSAQGASAPITLSSGNQNVSVTPPTAPPGAVGYYGIFDGLQIANGPNCNFIAVTPATAVSTAWQTGNCGGPSNSSPFGNGAAQASISSNGMQAQALVLTGGFKDTLSGNFTANRAATLPDNTGIVPVTSYVNSAYDNAARANGTIGSNWAVQQNGLNIASNQIQGTTGGGSNTAFWNANAFSPVQFAQATITALNGATDFPGVTALASGTGSSSNYYDCVENSTTIFLQRVVNAGTTNLTSTASSGAVGDLLRLEVGPGGALACFKNGVSTLTATDTQITSGSPGLLISGNVATEKNWSGGNLHPLAQLDTEQDWTRAQHFTQGVAFGTESFTASPRAEQNIFLPGALTSTWTGATWTNDKALTITRVQVQAKTAPAGCTTNAIVRLTDGTTPVNVSISAAANDSGAISQNYPAGSSLQVLVQTAAAGCTTSPADANVTVQYRMQ